MNRLTTNLMLSALLAAPTWAQGDTGPQKHPKFDSAGQARAKSVANAQDPTTPPFGPPTRVNSWSAEQLRDQRDTGVGYTEPPIIIDDWRGQGSLDVHWARLEGELELAGAELVRATEAGVVDSIEPFRQAVALHAAQLRGAHIYPFDDLEEFQPPVLELDYARDLHARAIDVAIQRRLRAVKVADRASDAWLDAQVVSQFDALRKLLSQRAQALGSSAQDLFKLRSLLTERQGASRSSGAEQAAATDAFQLELERQRMGQAMRVAGSRLDSDGVVQLADQLRMAKLMERVQKIRLPDRDQIVYPVR